MKSQPRPIQIPDDIAARCVGPDQAERMDRALRAVIGTPHTAVTKDTKKRARSRARRARV